MANEQHLEILLQGVKVWNQWRDDNPEIQPDLTGAELERTDLAYVDLHGANLTEVNIRSANLWLANLGQANLFCAYMEWADLRGASMVGASCAVASMCDALLIKADLRGAIFYYSDLTGVSFWGARLAGADFTGADVGSTDFSDTDLSLVKGLEKVIHQRPSSIGTDTIFRSKGPIPEVFLKGAGVPDSLIGFFSAYLGEPGISGGGLDQREKRNEALTGSDDKNPEGGGS